MSQSLSLAVLVSTLTQGLITALVHHLHLEFRRDLVPSRVSKPVQDSTIRHTLPLRELESPMHVVLLFLDYGFAGLLPSRPSSPLQVQGPYQG